MFEADRIPSVIAAVAWMGVSVYLAFFMRPRNIGVPSGLLVWWFAWAKMASAWSWTRPEMGLALMGYTLLAIPFMAALVFVRGRIPVTITVLTALAFQLWYLLDHGILLDPAVIQRLNIIVPLSFMAAAVAGIALARADHKVIGSALLAYPVFRLSNLLISLSISPDWQTVVARIETMFVVIGLVLILAVVATDFVPRMARNGAIAATVAGFVVWFMGTMGWMDIWLFMLVDGLAMMVVPISLVAVLVQAHPADGEREGDPVAQSP